MSHFVKVLDGKVIQGIVAEAEFFQTFVDSSPGEWIQTSYNTHGGVHVNGGTPLRKNYAGIGYVYDAQRDAFYAPQPYPSWTLDEATCYWKAPVDQPAAVMPTTEADGTYYTWDETIVNWTAVTVPRLTEA
jgi:hypothetical protein